MCCGGVRQAPGWRRRPWSASVRRAPRQRPRRPQGDRQVGQRDSASALTTTASSRFSRADGGRRQERAARPGACEQHQGIVQQVGDRIAGRACDRARNSNRAQRSSAPPSPGRRAHRASGPAQAKPTRSAGSAEPGHRAGLRGRPATARPAPPGAASPGRGSSGARWPRTPWPPAPRPAWSARRRTRSSSRQASAMALRVLSVLVRPPGAALVPVPGGSLGSGRPSAPPL